MPNSTLAINPAGCDVSDVESDRPSGATPVVDFCGELTPVRSDHFVIGRQGDLAIDGDNPFLHRRFLMLRREHELWCLANIGGGTVATVANASRVCVATLGPGATLALTDPVLNVRFSAGPTRYEFEIRLPEQAVPTVRPVAPVGGDHTLGRLGLTPDQKLLVLSLAEPVLRAGHLAMTSMPTSHHAARRLGWTITKFNRKLDNVCQKFAKAGVRGLHGGIGNLAFQRRVRLVEHSVSSRTVTADDLALLDAAVNAAAGGG